MSCTVKGIKWSIEEYSNNILYYYYLGHHGLSERISVLDRLTGYSGYVRDIETGFKDIYGNFWLASCEFDIREYPELTLDEAIALIKKNANTCNPDRDD